MISSRLADAADALLVEVVAIVLRSFEYQYHKLLLLRVSWVPARVSRFPKPSWHFVAPRIFEKGMTPLQAAPSSASQHHRSHGEERSTISQGSEEQRQRAWLPRHFRSHKSGLLQNLKHQPIQERERENLGLQNSKYSSQERISLKYLSNAGVPKQLSATCR